jgi:DNA modification methylase
MPTKLQWKTIDKKISDLVPNLKNPRVMSHKQMEDLKRSLTKYGVVELPVVDADLTLLAGHQRLLALKLLGREEEVIPVRMPNRKLTKSEADRYLLSSNRIHGDFDWEKLAENFSVDTLLMSGFDDADMTHLFNDLEVEDDDFDEIAEIKKIHKPTVKFGEMYQLGNHMLLCGDATNPRDVQRLVGKERIDFVDVDPPFSISYSYSGKNDKYGGQEKDDRSPEEYHTFIHALITNSMAVAKKDAHYLFWCDERFVWLLQTLYAELGIESKRLCIWVKNNSMPTPKTAFNKATEFAVYGTIGTPFINDRIKNLTTILNKEVEGGNKGIEDIIDLFNLWLVKRLPGNKYLHPTQKSPTLHEKALKRCTRIGDNLLDLTAGSGSLMVAAEQLKRRAFLCEMDPIFATLIVNRYEKMSGKQAKRL